MRYHPDGPGHDYRGSPGVSWRGSQPWYHGYRGYRYPRPGYQVYNGWWFPAFAFGAIAGALATQPYYAAPPVYAYRQAVPEDVWRRHVDWCYRRYRSYRASDNTFQPYHGPRQICYSPYF